MSDTTAQALGEIIEQAIRGALGEEPGLEGLYVARTVLDSGLVVPAAELAERDATIARVRGLVSVETVTFGTAPSIVAAVRDALDGDGG